MREPAAGGVRVARARSAPARARRGDVPARVTLAWTTLGLAVFAAGCPKPAPALREQRFAAPQEATRLVAIVPFYPRPTLERYLSEGTSASEAADLVTRFVTEALQAAGIGVIPASDVEVAFTGGGAGLPVPRLDPHAASQLAARQFGATGVLLGEVLRYREREGEALGSSRPASVSFLATLYAAPDATKVWSAQFDETQQPLSANVMNAPRYPGAGTRWLTAAELARWGARELAASLLASR